MRDLATHFHYMAVTRYNVRFYGLGSAGRQYYQQDITINAQTAINFASSLVETTDVNSDDFLYILKARPSGLKFEINLEKYSLSFMRATSTQSFKILEVQFKTPGGRLAATESGQVFACLHDVGSP